MSGLFRRLRRRKSSDDDEGEATPPLAEETPSDPDIYPHRGPDDSGDPDIVADETPVAEDPTLAGEDAEPQFGPDGSEPLPSSPERELGATGPSPAPGDDIHPKLPEVAPDPGLSPPPTTVSAPPPLPSVDEDADRAPHRPLAAPSRCFLCGTELNGSYCPTCRMTWNE
jgi:hypothetical protein